MKEYQIAVVKGDGVGPEIISEGMKVLDQASSIAGVNIRYTEYPFGGEYYLKEGTCLPDGAINEFKQHDAIYFGAAGRPDIAPGILEPGLILKMRFELDQYINLRPVKLYPNVKTRVKDLGPLDFYMVRENVEDFYNGLGARMDAGTNPKRARLSMKRGLYDVTFDITADFSKDDDYAINLGMMSRKNIMRVMKYSFDLAKRKGKTRVTAVDKCNVIPQMYGLWREEFAKLAEQHPELTTEYNFADAVNMWLVKDPERFGVVVLPNLMGDILTDLGAAISGGLGFAAGGNINPEGVSMFEPIHGSAPKYAGKNVINPIATIASAVLMMDELGEPRIAEMIEKAIWETMADGVVKTQDMGGTNSCSDMGDAVCAKLRELYDK